MLLVVLDAPFQPIESGGIPGDDHTEGIRRHDVFVVAAPRDGLGLVDVDPAVGQHALVDVDADDFPYDDVDGPHGRVPWEPQGGVVLALEPHGGVRDHGYRGLEDAGPRLGQAGPLELVHSVREVLCRLVDGLPQRVGGELPTKHPGSLGVADRVLLGRPRVLVRREHDVRGVECQIVEL